MNNTMLNKLLHNQFGMAADKLEDLPVDFPNDPDKWEEEDDLWGDDDDEDYWDSNGCEDFYDDEDDI